MLTLLIAFFTSWAMETPITVSGDPDIVARQISLATIAFTGVDLDHTKTDFPGVSFLNKIQGKTYPSSYLAAFIFTNLHNKIDSLDRERFGAEYNLMTLRVDRAEFLKKYFSLLVDMGLKNMQNGLVEGLVASKRPYITPVIAITAYMVLFLSNTDFFQESSGNQRAN